MPRAPKLDIDMNASYLMKHDSKRTSKRHVEPHMVQLVETESDSSQEEKPLCPQVLGKKPTPFKSMAAFVSGAGAGAPSGQVKEVRQVSSKVKRVKLTSVDSLAYGFKKYLSLDEVVSGAKVPVTDDGLVDATALCMAMTGQSAHHAACFFSRLDKDLFEPERFISVPRPGGGCPLKFLSIDDALCLILLMPGKNAQTLKGKMTKIFRRYLGGDLSLIQEIKENSESSHPIAQAARASLAREERVYEGPVLVDGVQQISSLRKDDGNIMTATEFDKLPVVQGIPVSVEVTDSVAGHTGGNDLVSNETLKIVESINRYNTHTWNSLQTMVGQLVDAKVEAAVAKKELEYAQKPST